MPVYAFVCDGCGLRQEQAAGMHDPHPETLPCVCGGKARRDWQTERSTRPTATKELYCDHNPYDPGVGAEVHPDQIAETNAYIKRHGFQGVHCEPTADGMAGRMVVTSKRGWKRYAESRGTFNKDGGHGDPQPGVQRRPPEPEFVTVEE